MNAEEYHYLKKLKNLQKCVQGRLEFGKLNNRNYLGLASWDKKNKTFKLHQILKSSKYHVKHIEAESLDKLEELKKEKDLIYMMARFSPCLQCAEMIIQWAEKNRINMMIFGFETMNSEFDIKLYLGADM